MVDEREGERCTPRGGKETEKEPERKGQGPPKSHLMIHSLQPNPASRRCHFPTTLSSYGLLSG